MTDSSSSARIDLPIWIPAILALITGLYAGIDPYLKGKEFWEIMGSIGSVASFFGLWIALVQLFRIADIADATKVAAEEARDSIRSKVALSNLPTLIESIDEAQGHLRKGSMSQALEVLKVIRSGLHEISHDDRNNRSDSSELLNLTNDLNIEVRNLSSQVDSSKKIDRRRLIKKLEDIQNVLEKLKAEMTYSQP